MAVSYTSALERDLRDTRVRARTLDARHIVLPITSVVALLAIGLAYAGRMHTAPLRDPARAGAPLINLNAIADAAALEPALRAVFVHDADRRLAARGLFEFVRAERDAGRSLPNVGALTGASVSARAIDADRSLVDFAERLRTRRAALTGTDRPVDAVPILTADALAAVKPALGVRSGGAALRVTLVCALLLLAAWYAVLAVWHLRGIRGDVLLLSSAHLLTGLGFALLVSRADPLRDTALIVRYTAGVVIGLAAMTLVSAVDFRRAAFLRLSYVPLVGAFVLSALLLLFGDGPGTSRARVNLGPVQPIEAIRLLIAFFLAGYFARRWELLRQVRSRTIARRSIPSWIHLPRPEYVLPVVVGVGTALAFFFLQRDLGPALLVASVFLAMYAVARARVTLALVGLLLLASGFYVGYRFQVSDTLNARVHMWLSPWDNMVRGGDQVAQSLWAVATGGWLGAGLGFSDTRYLPAGHTDLVLAAVGEELGLIGLLVVAAVYAFLAARGLRIALRSANDYGFFLATAITLFLMLPVLTMTAGVFGVTPLTGVVTPFLSYGGSAMVANLAALGVLVAIGAQPDRTGDMTPFRRPTLALGGTLAAAALALLIAVSAATVVDADEVAVRPHLSLHADGVRRYQYNPRVLDVARRIPRGSIYDRRGLALATSDASAIETARTAYGGHGLTMDRTCEGAAIRCYPLGGAAFHLLGHESTRANWSAPNTSYIERDADARLRGFDDHATSVSVKDPRGEAHTTLRRDYGALVPLLRHRYEPDHPDVRAFLAQPRDVHTTIDARLQSRVSAILARHAVKSDSRAAAVVLDPQTGALLASASYPFPTLTGGPTAGRHDEASWLDRARYGLYPPGSTFKLVTAAAALDRGLDPAELRFVCAPLSGGRVGARIAGWSRPVRDDVRDVSAHGALAMHDGFVHSCNAYFAQLAVRVGARALQETAARLGISTSPRSSVQRLRDTLPQAGYGQGDVVATPLRMARVVAALASGGTLRDAHWDAGPTPPAAGRLLSADASAVLAQYMRDAVVSGTGRLLRAHPLRIAGKTGTAEVAGAASHAWFVGFAPFDAAGARIAFAVVVENAGYGAAAAAPIAGEIVSAAADVGVIR